MNISLIIKNKHIGGAALIKNLDLFKKTKLSLNENVGIISNFLTEYIFTQGMTLHKIPLENYQNLLTKKEITTVLIEDYLYETDNIWYKQSYSLLISELERMEINIIVISTADRIVPEELKSYSSIIIDPDITIPSFSENSISIPIVVDQTEINPVNNTGDIDITYFTINKFTFATEILEYHNKFNPVIKKAEPLAITREVIKRLIQTVKRSKILYIKDEGHLDKTLLKFLEITSTLQNTLTFLETPKHFENLHSIAVDDYQVTSDLIRAFLNNKIFLNRILLKKTREVLINNSYVFFENIIELLNSNNKISKKAEISVIVTTKRKENLATLFTDLNKQEYVNIEVILLTHGYKLSNREIAELKNIAEFTLKILSENESTSFGNCLNKCIDSIEYDYVIKMDDDDFYFPSFLIDIYLGMSYSNATIVGKNAFFFYLENDNIVGQRRMDFQFKDVKEVKGNTILCKTSTMKNYRFSDIPRHVDSDFIIRIREDGGRIYSIHPYDMCVYRASDKTGHTYQVNDSRFLKDAHILYYGKPNKTISTE